MNTACTDCDPAPPPASSSPAPHNTAHAPAPAPAPQQMQSEGGEANEVKPADPALDTASFAPPDLDDERELPRVIIEFCDRCRWLHRAVWTQTELFLTFPPPVPSTDGSPPAPAGLKSITLVPRNAPETGGRFRVWLLRKDGAKDHEGDAGKESWKGWDLVWDRKVEGGFPELKVLKQRIRNLIAPSLSLGHSDKPSTAASATPSTAPPAPPVATAAATAEPAPAPATEASSTDTAPAKQERKPGQLLPEDFAPTFRCG
ncbi:hypothetical protein JCM10213_006998 [Rhodosporidiobolus nylandii]